MKKILFLSHVPFNSNYGAATSTRQHLEILWGANVDITLYQQTGLRRHNYTRHKGAEIKPLIANLDWLHDYNSGTDPNNGTLRYFISRSIKRAFEPFYLKKLRNFITSKNINILHLNSPVLCGISYRTLRKTPKDARPRIILHVRDVIKQNLSINELLYFSIVDDFVCIDNTTLKAVEKNLSLEIHQKAHLQGNPFLRDINNVVKTFSKKIPVQKNILNIAIVGALIKDKGVLDLCKFVLESAKNIRLFIVGDGELREEVQDLAQGSSGKILYLGEAEDLYHTDFYELIDILFRADVTFRIGRTVFEALYCGCNVAMPFTGLKSSVNLDDLENFNDCVHLWERNAEGFDKVISEFEQEKSKNAHLHSDPDPYRLFFQKLYS